MKLSEKLGEKALQYQWSKDKPGDYGWHSDPFIAFKLAKGDWMNIARNGKVIRRELCKDRIEQFASNLLNYSYYDCPYLIKVHARMQTSRVSEALQRYKFSCFFGLKAVRAVDEPIVRRSLDSYPQAFVEAEVACVRF